MKAVTIATLLWLTAPLMAQEPTFPGCPRCGVIGYVDLPATSATVSNAALLAGEQAIQGWGFERVSGHAIERVDVWVENDAQPGTWRPVPGATPTSAYDVTLNDRPDVIEAFAADAPIVGVPVGFTRWVDRAWPLGARRYLFVLWEGPYHVNLVKTLNVVE